MATPAELAKYDKKRVNPLDTLPKQVARAIENQQLGPSFRNSRTTSVDSTKTKPPAESGGAFRQFANETRAAEEQGGIAGSADLGTLQRSITTPSTPVQQYAADTVAGEADLGTPERVESLSSITENLDTPGTRGGQMRRGGADLTKPSEMPLTGEAVGRTPRVFTDAANARFNGVVVDYNETTGQNTYTDAGGNVIDPASFDPQGLGNEGPRLPGAEYDAFTPSARPGLTTTDGPFAMSDGQGGIATDQSLSFRQAAGGGAAPGTPPPAGGGGTGLSPEGQSNLAMLQRGLPQVQAAYDAAVAGGNQEEISRARLALLSQKADIAKVSMGDRLSTNRFDFEREMLRDWPTGNSPEAVIQRRRIASAINQNRTANQKLSIDQLNAEANYRNAEGGGRDAAQVRLDNANAALKENELVNRGLGVDFKSAMDEAGNLIAGGIITWPRHNLSVSAEDWSQVQAASSPGGEIYNAIAAQNPGADPESILETAMHAAMRKYGTPTNEG